MGASRLGAVTPRPVNLGGETGGLQCSAVSLLRESQRTLAWFYTSAQVGGTGHKQSGVETALPATEAGNRAV
jgi:hypothetical protein